MNQSAQTLFKLLSFAFSNAPDHSMLNEVAWADLIDMAFNQGVAAIAADGLQKVYEANPEIELALDTPEFEALKYEWFGEQMVCEQDFAQRASVEARIASIWASAGIDYVVLKGSSYAALYPHPEHRYSCDLDLLTIGDWKKANSLLADAGYPVDAREYKHSHIDIDGVHVENHQFVCGTKGDDEGKRFDKCLKGLLKEGKTDIFNVLFYLKHAQQHFLVEDGIQLKHVLDWVFLRKLVTDESTALIKDFGLDKFADAVEGVAAYVMGESETLSDPARIMLDDILAEKTPYSSGGSRFKAHVNILRTIWRRRRLYQDYSYGTALGQMSKYIWGYITER